MAIADCSLNSVNPTFNRGREGLLPVICVQSKVIGINEMPVHPPNNWFITTFFGLIHVTNAKTLRNLATMRM